MSWLAADQGNNHPMNVLSLLSNQVWVVVGCTTDKRLCESITRSCFRTDQVTDFLEGGLVLFLGRYTFQAQLHRVYLLHI